jgi:starch synthase (maltosyl-transferring)
MVGRIPVMDVTPVVEGGRYPAKGTVGEPFPVTALVFREGHDALNADVVLIDPKGKRRPPQRMRRVPEKVDLWRADVVPDAVGPWSFEIESWSDPIATWRHHAAIKIPAGIDVDLMFTEGALLLERAIAQLPRRGAPGARKVLTDAVKGLRDARRPEPVRYAAATSAQVDEVLDKHPLRDLVTTTGPFPVFVDRERALFGSWYEFFPRSEGAYID